MLFHQVDSLPCHRKSKVPLISLQLFDMKDVTDSRKLVFIPQCRSDTRLTEVESQCDEDDTTDFKRHRWISLTLWQHSYTPLRCASHTHTHTDTHTHKKQTDTQAHKHPSISILPALYTLSLSLSLSRLALVFTFTNTQSLGWGNWMWQQILRGLLAGYQVNLWNVTHLAPAGWLWHLQETRLNHSSGDLRLNTEASSPAAELFSLFM